MSCFNRGLRFIQVFLQSLVDGEKDDNNPNLVRVNITKAYDVALKRYHGWFVQQLFKVRSDSDGNTCKPDACRCAWREHFLFQAALFAAPYKSDFLKALSKGRDVKEEECVEKIRKFLLNFTATIDAIYDAFNRMNADLDYKVWQKEASLSPSQSMVHSSLTRLTSGFCAHFKIYMYFTFSPCFLTLVIDLVLMALCFRPYFFTTEKCFHSKIIHRPIMQTSKIKASKDPAVCLTTGSVTCWGSLRWSINSFLSSKYF